MMTDNFCSYLQNRLIQTSQTGGQQYSDTSPFSIPWTSVLLPKVSLPQIFSDFFKIDFAYFLLPNISWWVGTLHRCTGALPGNEGGIQVLVGLAPFSQTVGSFWGTPGWLHQPKIFSKK
jgi:hypothetical protein